MNNLYYLQSDDNKNYARIADDASTGFSHVTYDTQNTSTATPFRLHLLSAPALPSDTELRTKDYVFLVGIVNGTEKYLSPHPRQRDPLTMEALDWESRGVYAHRHTNNTIESWGGVFQVVAPDAEFDDVQKDLLVDTPYMMVCFNEHRYAIRAREFHRVDPTTSHAQLVGVEANHSKVLFHRAS